MKPRSAMSFLFLALSISTGVLVGQIRVVNSASYDASGPLAAGSFGTILGQNLCGQTAAGQLNSEGMYPVILGGCSLTLNGLAANMQYVGSGQINFVVPQSMGSGTASVAVNNGTQMLTGSMMIGPAGPGVFALNGTGMGDGAMLLSTTGQMGPFSAATKSGFTPVSIFMTGLDPSAKPIVSIAGVPVEVTFFGATPGFPGLQQINITLSSNMAGVGRVPVMVTSNGQLSNVTFINVLPTTAMMQGMPGWDTGMMVAENMARGAEMSSVAVNSSTNTALITDEAGDALRVISLDSKSTVATIALPSGSQAGAVAVSSSGTLAAIALMEKGSVALIDLIQNQVISVIGTGSYASRLAFSGTNLLVSNGASNTVTVIDTNARQVTRTVNTGLGPAGIAAGGNVAVVANMQGGSLSVVNLTDYSVANVDLPAGSRPNEVAISTGIGKALITNPMSNNAFILALDTRQVKPVDLAAWSGMGQGGVVTNGPLAFVADQMASNVAVIDLNAAKIITTFPVDPGPRSVAVNPSKNQLLVLCQGTGTLDLVDLTTYSIIGRINATNGTVSSHWTLPSVASITPSTAKVGSSFLLTINGSNLQGIIDMEFRGGSLMGGGMAMGDDPNIKVNNINVNTAGTQLTAAIQILSTAAAGIRQIRFGTNHGDMMGAMNSTLFTVYQ